MTRIHLASIAALSALLTTGCDKKQPTPDTLPQVNIPASARTPQNANSVDPGKLPPTASVQGVTYHKDIRPIMEASCFRCHGDRQQKGGLRVDSREALLKGGDSGEAVVVGSSEKSPLVIAVAQIDPDTAMPPKRGPGGGGPGGPGGPGAQGGPGGPGGPGGGDFLTRTMQNDKNGDGKLTKEELPERMQDMIERADTDKDGALSKAELEAMSRQFAQGGPGGRPGGQGPGGPGGPGGFGGRGPGGPGGGGGPQSQPLTPEQVGLVRAWIDQGAK